MAEKMTKRDLAILIMMERGRSRAEAEETMDRIVRQYPPSAQFLKLPAEPRDRANLIRYLDYSVANPAKVLAELSKRLKSLSSLN